MAKKKHGTKIVAQNNHESSGQPSHIAIDHQGPLPLATEFAAYENVLPGSADRIITMAEKSLELEIYEVRARERHNFIALISGRLFLYALLGVSVFLVIIDKPVAALLAGLAPIISVIYGTLTAEKKGK